MKRNIGDHLLIGLFVSISISALSQCNPDNPFGLVYREAITENIPADDKHGRSKLSNLLFTYELQRLFQVHKVDAMSLASHPGGSRTNLDRHLKGKFWYYLLWPLARVMTMSQAQGALSQIRASVDQEVKGGQYYGPHRNMTGYPILVESNVASHNMEDARKLWEMSEQLTGISFTFE